MRKQLYTNAEAKQHYEPNVHHGKSITVKMLGTCIFPGATYGCNYWTILHSGKRKISASELKCYRTVVRIAWNKDKTEQFLE